MRIITLIMLALTACLLQGCAFDDLLRREKEYVYVTQYQIVEPSFDMIRTCDLAPQPPEPLEYAKLSVQDKEKALHAYAAGEQLAMRNCNLRLDQLSGWYAKQRKLYEQANLDAAKVKKK